MKGCHGVSDNLRGLGAFFFSAYQGWDACSHIFFFFPQLDTEAKQTAFAVTARWIYPEKKTNLSNFGAANGWLESDVKTLTSFRSWRFCFFSDWLASKLRWKLSQCESFRTQPAMAERLAQQVEVKCLASCRLHRRKPGAGSDVWCYLSEGAVTSTFGWTSSCPNYLNSIKEARDKYKFQISPAVPSRRERESSAVDQTSTLKAGEESNPLEEICNSWLWPDSDFNSLTLNLLRPSSIRVPAQCILPSLTFLSQYYWLFKDNAYYFVRFIRSDQTQIIIIIITRGKSKMHGPKKGSQVSGA